MSKHFSDEYPDLTGGNKRNKVSNDLLNWHIKAGEPFGRDLTLNELADKVGKELLKEMETEGEHNENVECSTKVNV